MSKLKNFWEKHKTKILVVGGVIVGGTIIYLLTKDSKYISKIDLRKSKAIVWPADYTGHMEFEKVKELLEANKDNVSQFAIFREGPNPNDYVTILLSDNVTLV